MLFIFVFKLFPTIDAHHCGRWKSSIHSFFDEISIPPITLDTLINGVGGNVFDSKSTFTRAMIVQVLYNLEGKPATEYEMTFNDIAEDAWYADAVRWAQSTGIVGGLPDGSFAPNGAVTREQTALILMNYAKYKKLDVTKRNVLNEYSDMSKISSWALDAVKWANALKLINGSDSKLNPTGDATRAEAVTILVRFIENVK